MLREGDLTGLVLADFCGCNKALVIDNPAPDAYCVLYDTRIARGIPQFFNLVTRMLWDMRQGLRSQQGASFKVTFVAAKNVDLSRLVVDDVTDVPGVQENPGTMTVYSAPMIRLDARNGSETVSASVALENDGDAPGNKNEGVGEKPQSFQPKSWAEDETRDRVYALADRCLADQDELDQAEAEKAKLQRKLDSITKALVEATSKFDHFRGLERKREQLTELRNNLDNEVSTCEKELQSFGLFDISNKRQVKKKLSELAGRIEKVDSSLKSIGIELFEGSSELAKVEVDKLQQQEGDAQLALKEAEANFEQKEATWKEGKAELEAFCASVPDNPKMDRFCWDADWRIKQARDRRERAEYQQKKRRFAKELAQAVEVGEEFGVRDMVDAVDGLDSITMATTIIVEYYKKTHSVKRVAPLYNLPAYVFTDKRFMDLLDD